MGREERTWDGSRGCGTGENGYGTGGEDVGREERMWDERENMGREERIWDGRKEMGRERGYGTGGKDVGREREDVGREDFFSSDSGELFSSPLTLFELGAGTRHSWCF